MPDSTNPFDAYFQNGQAARIQSDIMSAPSPDTMAAQTRAARQSGLPTSAVPGLEQDIDRSMRARRTAALAQAHPAIGAWAAQNPRDAVAASDDHRALGIMGSAWQQLKQSWAQSHNPLTSVIDAFAAGVDAFDAQDVGSRPAALNLAAPLLAGTASLMGDQQAIRNLPSSMKAVSALGAGAVGLGRWATTDTAWALDLAGVSKDYNLALKADKALSGFADYLRPKSSNWVQEQILGGIENAPSTIASFGTGLALRGFGWSERAASAAAILLPSLQQGGDSYLTAREQGVGRAMSTLYGMLDTAAEAGGEYLGEKAFIHSSGLGDSVLKRWVKSQIPEVVGETGTTLAEDITGQLFLPENRDKTWAQLASEMPVDALATAIQTVIGGGLANATLGATERALNTVAAQRRMNAGTAMTPRFVAAVQGLRDASILEAIGRSAEQSKLRSRDPDAHANLVAALAQDAGVENVMVSPDAIRSYQQADSYDQFEDPFRTYEAAIAEAEASGGDVVLPAEFALSRLPGTPAWQAIKDDLRLRPDGMTAREARDLADTAPQLIADTFNKLSQEDRTAAQERTEREAMVEKLTAQIQNAGYTPRNAAIVAELVAQRASTRAKRLGRDMVAGDFDTRILRVMPPALADARKADDLDLVINAMRQGKPATNQKGKTLLEWIAARGGINDSGGDLRSMGLDKWHLRQARPGAKDKRGRPTRPTPIAGRRQIIRAFDPGQRTMGAPSGEGDFGHDSTLRAAIEAGYFPELEHVQTQELDTNDLLSAIGDELAGRPRHSTYDSLKVDNTRLAARELQQLIEDQGRDPRGMTDAEIRKLVEDMRLRPTQNGRAYEQAPKPVAVIHGDEIAPETTHGADLRKEAFAWYQEHLRGQSVRSKALGQDVVFASPKKMRAFSADEEKLRAVTALPAIIGNGELVLSRQPYDQAKEPSVKAYHVLEAWVEIGGQIKLVRAVVREANNGHFYYDHSLPENAARNPESPGNKTGTGEPDSYEQSKVSGDNFNLLMQDQERTPRGRILMPADGWGTGPATIELFEKANASTLLHELGHQWLEELRFDAALKNAPDELRHDWEAVKAWFAENGHPIGEDGAIPVDGHELWARGVERYLMEGKAPASGIARVFERIKGWMLNVYRTVADLHAPITPEIRQVFDRLLATDEEIETQRTALSMRPAITDPTEIGMTGPEFDAYRKLAGEARDAAHAELLRQTMAEIRRQRTAEWRRERDKVKSEETLRLEREPVIASLRLMAKHPINREWVIDRMGEDALDLLPKRVPPMTREGGANPDEIAELAGFGSGRAMLDTLIGLERQHRQAQAEGDGRTIRERMIDNATEAEMQRRYADDPLNDGSIEEEAIAAVNNELGGQLLATELRYLGRRTGQTATPYQAAREWARSKVLGGVIAVEASPGAIQRHSRAVAKAGREAEKALMAGHMDEAFAAKQRQMIAAALLAEAKVANEDVTKAQDRMSRIAKRRTMKSVDQSYLDQAHALLDDVQLGPRSQRSIDRQGKWESWAAGRAAEGFDVVVPGSFEATIKGTHWSRLTVEQFLGLRDAVDQVMHLGRLKQTLLDKNEEREWNEIFHEAEKAAANITGPAPKSLADQMSPGYLDRLKDGVVRFDAALLRMETVFDWLDGGNSDGVFNRIAFKPIADAQFREQAMLKDYLGSIKDLFEAIPEEDRARWNDRLTLPWIDPGTGELMVMTRQQAIAMALNIGNDGNLQRLTDGYRLNKEALEAYLGPELTSSEWHFVQSVWDRIETLWPEIEALEKRVNGVAPDKIEPREFWVVPKGSANGAIKMRGGYYPAVYDTTRDTKAERHNGEAADLLDARYTRANTRASATKDRSEKVRAPILLDLGVINRHLSEVVHDITHREAVIQAWRFLSDDRVQNSVKAALGPEYAKQFRPWVKSVANSMAMDRTGAEGVGKYLRRARTNVTMVGLGLRATTIMVHTSGLAAGASLIGEKWMGEGLAAMARNPAGATQQVLAASSEVRGHLEHFERDIGTMIDALDRSNPATRAMQLIHEGQKFAMYGIGWMVQRVSVPIWIGAYNKAISEGLSDEDARFAADKAVRYAVGASGAKDLTAIQRPGGRFGEAFKMLTMFYTSMASQYQRHRTLARDIAGADQRRPRNLSKLASRAFWGIAMVPIWDEIIRMAISGHGPDDDEWWAAFVLKKFLANMLGPIPVARDVFEPIWDGIAGRSTHGASITPLQGIYDSVFGRVPKDIGHLWRGEPTKRATRDVLEATGYLTGMVPGQFAAASQFLVDVADGSAHPESVRDWMNGLSTGRIAKHG